VPVSDIFSETSAKLPPLLSPNSTTPMDTPNMLRRMVLMALLECVGIRSWGSRFIITNILEISI
jgi:hypothetical protein